MVKFRIEFENNDETRILTIGNKEFKWTLKSIQSKEIEINDNEIVEINGESDDYTFETQLWNYNKEWCEDDIVYEAFITLDNSDDIEEIQQAIQILQVLDK